MHIGDLINQRFAKKQRGTYRTDMVQEFQKAINLERLGTKYKQLSFVTVLKKLEHLSDPDVAYLLSICRDAKNRVVKNEKGEIVQGSFSKVFFGALKVRNDGERST